MRAKLIYSDVLYTASNECLSEVKVNYDKYNKHYIIVPDKYTLICEKMLLNALNVDCSFKAEVLSLNRLCSKVLDIKEVLDKQSGIVLIQKILFENNDKFKVFKNMYKKVGFAEKLYSTIMQIKSSNVTIDDLSLCGSDEAILNAKLDDLKIVYSVYENSVANGLYDGIYKLDQLVKLINNKQFFKNCAFYFAFFDFFTQKEYQIIDSLIGSGVFVCMATSYATGKPNEHIYTNTEYTNLNAIMFKYGLNDIVQASETLPKHFDKLKNELFSYNPTIELLKDDSIQIFKASGEKSEVENVARQIKEYIVAGYKYNEICIGVSDINQYEILMDEIFSKYNINYFVDNSIMLDNTELGRFMCSVLNGVAYGFMEEDLKSIIFNYYFGLEDDAKEQFYKFMNLLKPKGLKWLDKQYELQSDVVNSTILKVKEKLNYIIATFKGKKTGAELVGALRQICEYFNIDIMTDALITKFIDDLKISKTLSQLNEKIYEMFDMIEKLSSETIFDISSFLKLILSSLKSFKINLVPQSVDGVFVGDINSSSFERKKIVFLLGTNLGKAPLISYDLGLILDKDIDNLSAKFLIEPKISQINARSKLKLFEICLTARDFLVLSYLSSDDAGNELKPSYLITNIQKMFETKKDNKKYRLTSVTVDDDYGLSEKVADYIKYANENKLTNVQMKECDNAQKLKLRKIANSISIPQNCYKYMFFNKNNALLDKLLQLYDDGLYLNNLKKIGMNVTMPKTKLKTATSLYFVNNYTSATQITTFFTCPYKHFLRYGIKLKEDLPYALKRIDIGNILHRVCELFVTMLKNSKNTEFNLENAKTIVMNKIKQEFSDILDYEDNRFVVPSLKNEAIKLMDQLYNFSNSSNFKTLYTEYNFKPYKIENNYKNVSLKGGIDRIDVLGDKFVIIDYKTGDSKLELNDVYFGLKMQLILYALAYSKESNKQVVGFGYFPIKDSFTKLDASGNSGYKIQGIFDKDINVLYDLDKTLVNNENDKKESKFYDFYIKDNEKLTSSTNVMELNKIMNIVNYVRTLLENAVNSILDGDIMVSPYQKSEKGPCDNCEYVAICKKDLYERCHRKLGSMPKNYFNK